jgi:hypothetical protein
MTLAQLRAEYPAYRIVGHGLFAVVCSSAGRITLAESLDVARELKHMNCGHRCDRYTNPHEGIRLDAPAPIAQRFRVNTYRERGD